MHVETVTVADKYRQRCRPVGSSARFWSNESRQHLICFFSAWVRDFEKKYMLLIK